jgi:hypothetical protein
VSASIFRTATPPMALPQHWGVSNGQIVGIGGKCLDSMRGGTADGTPLIIVTCSNNPTQQWSLQ